MLITPELIRDLQQIIRNYHAGLAASLFGQKAVTPEAWQLAIDLGLISDPTNHTALISELVEFGALMAHLEQAAARPAMSLDEFRAHVRAHPIPQMATEASAAAYNARVGASYITGLGDRAAHRAHEIMTEQERKTEHRTRTVIRDITSARFGDPEAQKRLQQQGIARGLPPDFITDSFRQTNRQAASDLGHLTGEWTRDLRRITTTEGMDAINHGLVEAWEEINNNQAQAQQTPPPRMIGYKATRPDACPHCERLHNDVSGAPRLYWLDEIQGNGSNVGRPANQWQIVIGPTHPWCVTPETPVLTRRGEVRIDQVTTRDLVWTRRGWRRVLGVLSRSVDEQICEVDGLRVTAGHEIWAHSRGWVRAGDLKRGDALLQPDQISRAESDHAPVLGAKVLGLPLILGLLAGGAVPASAVDLDCDLVLREGQIDQVAPDLVAGLHEHAEPVQGFVERLFQLRSDPTRHAVHPALNVGLGVGSPARRCMGCGNPLGLRGGVLPPGPDLLGLPQATGLTTAFPEPQNHTRAGEPGLPGDLEHGQAFGEVQADRFLGRERMARWSHDLSGFKLVAVQYNSTVRYSGRVYDLVIDGADEFVAGGRLVHNCYCTLHKVPTAFIPRIVNTAGWRSGHSCPTVIGPGGTLV